MLPETEISLIAFKNKNSKSLNYLCWKSEYWITIFECQDDFMFWICEESKS